MAKYRAVQTEFWTDSKVVEEMSAEDRYFFLSILTVPNTTQIGIYEITVKQLAFYMGHSVESVRAMMERFEEKHQLIKYNKETRELAIRNWGKHNLERGGKPMLDCVESELREVKDKSLITYVKNSVTKAEIRALYDTYDDTCTIRTTISTQKEKEKEKENYMGTNVPAEPAINFKDIQDYWNNLVMKPAIRNITAKRKSHLRARIKEFDVDTIYQMIDNVSKSDFLMKPDNTWFSFDWCINPNNFTKIIEGKYDNVEAPIKKKKQKMQTHDDYDEFDIENIITSKLMEEIEQNHIDS